MTPQQYRLIGYDDGLSGREAQYHNIYDYMDAFREGRRRLIRNKVKKIRRQYLWARQVREEK